MAASKRLLATPPPRHFGVDDVAQADIGWMAIEARRRRRRAAPQHIERSAFDPTPYSASALDRARRIWTLRTTAEHESALIFTGLLPFAVGARSSLDTQMVILGMAEDEIRHAMICAEAARALGSEPAPLEVAPVLNQSARPIAEQFLCHVIYGSCLTETVNVARLVDASERTRDPFMRQTILSLLSDEIRHAKFGFVLLAEWGPWLQEHPNVVRALDTFLPGAFASLDKAMSGVGVPHAGFGDDDVALGIFDPRRLPETFYVTVEHAIIPGLERLGLAASAAWRARTRSETASLQTTDGSFTANRK